MCMTLLLRIWTAFCVTRRKELRGTRTEAWQCAVNVEKRKNEADHDLCCASTRWKCTVQLYNMQTLKLSFPAPAHFHSVPAIHSSATEHACSRQTFFCKTICIFSHYQLEWTASRLCLLSLFPKHVTFVNFFHVKVKLWRTHASSQDLMLYPQQEELRELEGQKMCMDCNFASLYISLLGLMLLLFLREQILWRDCQTIPIDRSVICSLLWFLLQFLLLRV